MYGQIYFAVLDGFFFDRNISTLSILKIHYGHVAPSDTSTLLRKVTADMETKGKEWRLRALGVGPDLDIPFLKASRELSHPTQCLQYLATLPQGAHPPHQCLPDACSPSASRHSSSRNKWCSRLSLTPTEPVSNSFWLFPGSFYRTNILTEVFLVALILLLLLSPLILIKHSLVVGVGQGRFLSFL